MIRSLSSLTVLLFSAGVAALHAQQPLILLDPARGGSEDGAQIADRVDEKAVTLATAQRLAILLRARGFAVEMTRDSDTDVTNDARAAMANTTHPIACILLHATPVGSGVHLFSTSLAQGNADPGAPVLWNAAQSPFADRSHALTDGLRTAFGRSRIPVSAGQTWMRPLDNMQCPAVAVEISPEPDGGPAADDAGYQSRVASVIAGAMIFWRGKYAAMTPQPTPPPAPAVQPAAAVQPAPASQPVATPPASRLAP